jgi:hypothetical protein
MKSKSVLVALRVSAASTTAAAADTKKPVAKWTGEQFLAISEEYKPKVVHWASAHAKGCKPEASVKVHRSWPDRGVFAWTQRTLLTAPIGQTCGGRSSASAYRVFCGKRSSG